MLFLPYRMDSDKNGIPFFTLIICIICLSIYWNQHSRDTLHYDAIDQFCYEELDRKSIAFLRDVSRQTSGNHCSEIFEAIRNAENSDVKMAELAKQARPVGIFASPEDDYQYTLSRLEELYANYNVQVPSNLTNELVYDPKELDVARMITSTFSHGDVFHLLGNLLFFYIFSASVELIMGSFMYFGFITVATFGTSLAYSYAMMGIEDALPTLGLSGVVMAAVAALGIMMPAARIRCFFWFLIYFRVFRLPALILAIWYIGWDVYGMSRFGTSSYINYVAHLSGAGIGALFGIAYFLFRKDILREAALDY